MIHWTAVAVGDQVLLADVGDVARVLVLGEQMVERLIAVRTDFFRDRIVPFLAIGEDRVDIKNHSAEVEQTVANHVTNTEARAELTGRLNRAARLIRKKLSVFHTTSMGLRRRKTSKQCIRSPENGVFGWQSDLGKSLGLR